MSEILQKPVNFRDLGGIKTADGKSIKHKRLLRSGELVGLGERDCKLLTQNYQLEVIVDFRTAAEAKSTPDDKIENVRYVNIDIFEGHDEKASAMAKFEKIKTEQTALDFMYSVYETMMIDPVAQQQFGVFLRMTRDNQKGALLFHCFAGKDRTGLAAAMVLTLLGVPKEEIFADYMRTNELRQAWNAAMLAEAVAEGYSEQEMRALHAAFYAQPGYLQHSFAQAEKEYGSFESFLRQAIGITDADIAQLKHGYLD